eukprot:CAMPEP_0118878890 /NCGR_PEP_ID=MMETSP1163-20130328/18757_1 /TAXON_ID=124430 /ORGANISM="Phaeomonas parva, Strain CCMP2877" /LENGTH=251 /DNA_ID=CAMNT_0006814865 /DNA_START=95 /DNA_END=850 /DNA_ORIENTATION=+
MRLLLRTITLTLTLGGASAFAPAGRIGAAAPLRSRRALNPHPSLSPNPNPNPDPNPTALSAAAAAAAAADVIAAGVEASSTLSVAAIGSNADVAQLFNAATFGPQILWLFMILLPNAGVTKKIMGPLPSVIAFCLVHFAIVVISASQEAGTAPIAEFAGVFDPAGEPLKAMQGMMSYPNFVSEEWSHVLTWDLFVGRYIWLDGLRRGIFTPHSVLLCNLIGPPGLLLHCATSLLSGKGLPGVDELEEESEA